MVQAVAYAGHGRSLALDAMGKAENGTAHYAIGVARFSNDVLDIPPRELFFMVIVNLVAVTIVILVLAVRAVGDAALQRICCRWLPYTCLCVYVCAVLRGPVCGKGPQAAAGAMLQEAEGEMLSAPQPLVWVSCHH